MLINGPGELALKLADRMMKDIDDFKKKEKKDKGLYKLEPEQIMRFRDAVAKEWGLVKTIFADGTISDRTGAQTIYNGVVTCFSCWGKWGKTLRPTGQSAGAAMRGGAASLGSWGQTFRPTGQSAGAAMPGGAASLGSRLFPRRELGNPHRPPSK